MRWVAACVWGELLHVICKWEIFFVLKYFQTYFFENPPEHNHKIILKTPQDYLEYTTRLSWTHHKIILNTRQDYLEHTMRLSWTHDKMILNTRQDYLEHTTACGRQKHRQAWSVHEPLQRKQRKSVRRDPVLLLVLLPATCSCRGSRARV